MILFFNILFFKNTIRSSVKPFDECYSFRFVAAATMGKISVTDADEIWGCSEPDSQNQVTIQGLKKGLVAFFTKRGIPIPDDKIIAVSPILACVLYAGWARAVV